MHPERWNENSTSLVSIDRQMAIGEDEGTAARERVTSLLRYWKPIVLVFLGVFSLAAANTLMQRKVYETSAKLVVATKDASGGAGDLLGGLMKLQQGRNVDTQVEIINSPDLIESAFLRFSEADRMRGFGALQAPEWSYKVASREETDVIQVTTRSFVPELAAEFANSIARTYLKDDLERNSQATRQARQYVEREMKSSRSQLATAASALANFKKKTGLVAPSEQVTKVASNAVDLQLAYENSRTESVAAKQKLSVLRRELAKTDSVIEAQSITTENPAFAQSRESLAVLESKLVELGQEFTPNSPEVQQVENQIKAERSRLRDLATTAIASVSRQRNPVLDKLLEGYVDATAATIIAAEREKALGRQVSALNGELLRFPDQERQLAELQQRADVLNRTFNLLSDRYYTLLIEERSSLPSGIIAAEARAPKVPSSPRILLSLFFAFILAAIASVSVGLLLERLDTKAHRPDEVEKLYGLTSLALVPEATPVTESDDRLLIGNVTPNHAFTEGFRLLRNNIGFVSPDRPLHVIAVTSAAMGEGKSTTSVNLAIAMAMDGKRVLIIDADLRRPTIHKWMKVPNNVGFSSVVRGLVSLEDAVQPTPHEGLTCLTSGPLPPDPTEFLNSERSHDLLYRAKELYDVVIVDAPPCTGLSDVQVISTMVDGVVVVAALDKAPKPLMMAAIRMLRQANANLLGLVINRMKHGGQGYYGYYGYYGYNSYDQESPSMEGKSKKRKKKELAKRA